MLKRALEALLFVATEPLSIKKLSEVTGASEIEIKQALDALSKEYQREERGFQLREIAGGYRLYTHPKYAVYIERLILSSDLRRLTRAALETLAIIAYKQPITRSEISSIRGVNVDSVIGSLLSKGLIEEVGRSEAPGQPILYGTTQRFLESFGLKSLDELPPLEKFEPDEETKRKIRYHLQSETAE